MPALIRPPDNDVTAYMRLLFLRAERDIINEIKRKRASGYVEYAEAAALERIQKILQSLVDESWSYVPKMIEKIFYHSDKDAAGYANARNIASTAGTLSAAQTSIVQQLTNNLLGEITETSNGAYESTQKVFTIARLENDPLRKEALQAVLKKEAEGKPWITGSKSFVQEMENQGIPVFVDKRGRKWSMQDYGNMAVRTTARQAQVAAMLTADEYDLWQIVKIGSTCPVCAPFEGRVYSKSGTNPDYPPLAIAFGKIDPAGSNDLTNTYMNIHPNCLHSFVKYTTIGKSADRIQKDKDFSSVEKNPLSRDPRTKKQVEAYREKQRNRQQLYRDMKQHKEYQAVLGKDIPKDFAKFRDLKYNDSEKWEKIQISYEDTKLKEKIKSDDTNKTIHSGKQGKHILGHNNYKAGRSYLTITEQQAQELVNQYAGTGQIIRDRNNKFAGKERIIVKNQIGVCVDLEGKETPTNSFVIHYSKDGVHIVPAGGTK